MRLALTVMMFAASASYAQSSAYDADTLGYDGAVDYDAGNSVLAALLWHLAGKAGSSENMTAHAALRESGDGVAKNPKDAFRWYVHAARRGDAHATALLADGLFAVGSKQAKALYAQAAAQGHNYAMLRLAQPPGEFDGEDPGGIGENQ